MSWIKRNLYFLVGSALALILMGAAGWYLYSKWGLNEKVREDLNTDYTELDRLNKNKPHPGAGAIDNIKAASQQQAALLDFKEKAHAYFLRIPAIPDLPKVTAESFSTNLSHAIGELQHQASVASVSLPDTNYAFSFAAQNARVVFAPGGLEPLSVQVGEVKAICQVLFQAKINALDSVKRCRVSNEDQTGNATDYLAEKSTTNELAIVTPYEVTFRCFSQELGDVLAGFASSPLGFVIKTINVDPAPVTAPPPQEAPPAVDTALQARISEEMMQRQAQANAQAAFRNRYGGGGGMPRPMAPVYQPVLPAAAPVKTGLNMVLDEKQLKVVMTLNLVKLLPDAKPATARPTPKPVAAK
jgi:hypothetical protein